MFQRSPSPDRPRAAGVQNQSPCARAAHRRRCAPCPCGPRDVAIWAPAGACPVRTRPLRHPRRRETRTGPGSKSRRPHLVRALGALLSEPCAAPCDPFWSRWTHPMPRRSDDRKRCGRHRWRRYPLRLQPCRCDAGAACAGNWPADLRGKWVRTDQPLPDAIREARVLNQSLFMPCLARETGAEAPFFARVSSLADMLSARLPVD